MQPGNRQAYTTRRGVNAGWRTLIATALQVTVLHGRLGWLAGAANSGVALKSRSAAAISIRQTAFTSRLVV